MHGARSPWPVRAGRCRGVRRWPASRFTLRTCVIRPRRPRSDLPSIAGSRDTGPSRTSRFADDAAPGAPDLPGTGQCRSAGARLAHPVARPGAGPSDLSMGLLCVERVRRRRVRSHSSSPRRRARAPRGHGPRPYPIVGGNPVARLLPAGDGSAPARRGSVPGRGHVRLRPPNRHRSVHQGSGHLRSAGRRASPAGGVHGRRLRGRTGLLPLAGQGPFGGLVHRRDLQLGERHRGGG